MGFFSSPSDSIVFLLCYTFILLLIQVLSQKHRFSWDEGEPGALWVQYFSFAKFRFPAHCKDRSTSDDGLVPIWLFSCQPSARKLVHIFFFLQECSLGMFGLCWASLFFLAALVSCVHILKTVIKTHYPPGLGRDPCCSWYSVSWRNLAGLIGILKKGGDYACRCNVWYKEM